MNKKVIFRTIQAALAIFIVILIQRCGGDDTVNAVGTFMGGTITYNSTTLRLSDGYYAVSFYGDSANPLSHAPLKTDSLAVGVNGGVASVYYKETNLPTGNYYITSNWIRSSNHEQIIIGALGCDTTLHCSTPTKVTFPNYAGTGALNFFSFADPNHPIYP